MNEQPSNASSLRKRRVSDLYLGMICTHHTPRLANLGLAEAVFVMYRHVSSCIVTTQNLGLAEAALVERARARVGAEHRLRQTV